jgi:hypothetical protein
MPPAGKQKLAVIWAKGRISNHWNRWKSMADIGELLQ